MKYGVTHINVLSIQQVHRLAKSVEHSKHLLKKEEFGGKKVSNELVYINLSLNVEFWNSILEMEWKYQRPLRVKDA